MGLKRRVPTGMHGLSTNMNEDARGVLLQEVIHPPFYGVLAVSAGIDGDDGGASSFSCNRRRCLHEEGGRDNGEARNGIVAFET